eukprot:473173-Rhodomonas_salina.1
MSTPCKKPPRVVERRPGVHYLLQPVEIEQISNHFSTCIRSFEERSQPGSSTRMMRWSLCAVAVQNWTWHAGVEASVCCGCAELGMACGR